MSTQTQTTLQCGQDILVSRIASFVSDFSIETTPGAFQRGEFESAHVARDKTVFIAHPPNMTLDNVLGTAERVQSAGYKAVPHLVARKLSSVGQLESALKRLQQAGITRILVVAGDQAVPNRTFDSTLEVFYTGMLERYGFTEIGFAGHPEGSRNIGASLLKQALEHKLAYAAQSPSRFFIMTQFGFDAGAVIAFEETVRGKGYDIPIHVGMVGITELKKLLMYAARCGVRSSLGLLMDRSDIMKGVLSSESDRLIRAYAAHKIAEPDCLFSCAHFFAFGSLDRTVRWAEAVSAGKIELTGEKGFRVLA